MSCWRNLHWLAYSLYILIWSACCPQPCRLGGLDAVLTAVRVALLCWVRRLYPRGCCKANNVEQS